MLFRIIIILISFASLESPAQYAPKKTQNNDLRSKNKICSINFKQKKKTQIFSLDSNAAGQFHLTQMNGEDIVVNKKIDHDQAKQIDEKFVESFIELKYMMTSKIKDKCSDENYSLFMRGDLLTVCLSDKERVSIINSLISLLK